jgi:hypothetical protein
MVRLSTQRVALSLLVLVFGSAGPIWSAQAQTPAPRTVALRPAKGPMLRIDFNYNFSNALPPFENEPVLTGKQTARGLIPTVPPTPLLRNITDNELYLKADHSRDFSSGPSVTYQSRYNGHVLFENLKVSTERDGLTIPYAVHMFTYETGCAGWLEGDSAWAGDFDLDGQTWTLGIVDNLDGRINAGDHLYLLRTGSTEAKALTPVCPVPETLFFAGHAFRLEFAFKQVASEIVLEAELTELHPEMGKLAIEADGCRRLRLRCDPLTAIFEDPAGTVALPVGTYRVEDCVLYHEGTQWNGPKFVEYGGSLSIRSGQTASLRLGKPLSNSVEVSRDRNLLRLSYQLVGAGGERYSYYNWMSPPSFTIHKGPLCIAHGTFPFG